MNRINRYVGLVFALIICVFAGVSPALSGEVTRATLKNGLRVVIVQNSLAPVVTTQVNYLVGSNEAPPGFPGMAHAQEHMMFRGNPGLTSDQLSSIIAAMGGNFNAQTEQSLTQYFFTVPVEDLETALHVEAVRMRGIIDSDKAWKEERGAIEQEVVQDLSDPQYILSTRLLGKLFAGAPYEHDALGTVASFDKTTGAMLKRFYDDWYAPNNAILVIAGNVEPQRTLATVKRLFGGIPRKKLPAHAPIALSPLKPAEIQLDSDLSYGLALVAYRFPGLESPDYAAGMVLSDVLSSQRANLYALVPEGKALSTSFDSYALPKMGYAFALSAFPQGEDGHPMVETLKKIIHDYVTNGVPPELVEASKRHEIAQAEFQKNSVEGLASAWSQALALEGRSSPDDDIQAIGRVTVEDVNRVARNFLANDTAITAIMTPRQSGSPVESKGSGRTNESFAPKQVKKVKLPAWAAQVTRPHKVAAVKEGPTDLTLKNGIRLIVKTTRTSDTVSLYGHVKNNPGLEAPPGREGVEDILGGLFSYGSKSLNRLAFQSALDEIAADAEVGPLFSLQVVKGHFDRGVALVADNLINPALPEEAFKVVQKETSSLLAGQEKSPKWLVGRALRTALFPKGDPALRYAKPATVEKLTLADVRDYYHAVFRPDVTTIVVVGNITPGEARAVIEKHFGGWKAEGPKPETEYRPVADNKPAAVVVPNNSRVQDEVSLEETLGITRSHPDYYPLQVGLHILTGAFYATRLYHDLRETNGLVYAVDAFLNIGKTRSSFGVDYGCDPRNVSKARSIIERDLADMRTNLVSPDELSQAKNLLVHQVLLSSTSTASIALGLLHLSQLDLPLDEPARAADRYQKVSAAQVRSAFSKWIRPDGFVQVTSGPQPQ
ncbi:pitrilysin family protein [Geobacter sp. AOG2]|uniref:M16 family metallopeptidase n=1 Tax=Geobacter sp. AOG2 TaxID=1566347 RepID=UPI001CC3C6B7|nr:pitrilysin family protein [Geobacter sp. AOG2]GFE62641.1 peptidase M16 [Geobacter sp. AOG2]